MRIVIPFPVKELWPNGRPHRMAKARAIKKARTEAAYLAMSAEKPILGDGAIPVRVTVHAKQYGVLPDRDSCVSAIKAHLDGIADALGINDRNFDAPTVTFSPERTGKFVIEIGNGQVRDRDRGGGMSAFLKHGIDHLSASSVNLFIAQPALWCASYLMKRRPPVGPAAHRGTAIECGVEAGLFDPELPVEECQRLALAKFHALTRLSADPRIEKERDTVAPSVEIALTELRQYGVPEKPADGRQHKLEIALDGVAVPVIGYLDFVWPQHGIIGDLKSTSRIPSEIGEAHARQGSLYLRHGSNLQVRMIYVSPKKLAAYVVGDAPRHIASFVQAAQAIERLLSLSDDPEHITRCFAPDLGSFYWGDQSARRIAQEIWGASAPNDAPPVHSAA